MTQLASLFQPARMGVRSLKTLSCVAALGLALVLAGTAHAAVGIVSYSLASASPTATGLNATASTIGNGVGITGFTFNQTIANSLYLEGFSPDTTAAAAVAAANYFQFTVTPATGYALNLTTLAFNELPTPLGGVVGYDVRTSVNGFAGDVQSAGGISSSTPVSVSLAGAGYQGLSSPLTVRIYVFSTLATGTTLNQPLATFNNLILGGTVTSVPEPTTLAMLGVGAALLGLRRRRA